MYQALGNFVVRSWPILLVGWLALLLTTTLAAPNWENVTDKGQTSMLPADVPSNRGQALLDRSFPNELQGSSIVIVLRRAKEPIREEDRDFIALDLEPALFDIAIKWGGLAAGGDHDDQPAPEPAKKGLVSRIVQLNDKGSGAMLISADKRATLVLVDLTTNFQDRNAWPALEDVENLIGKLHADKKVPEGLELAVTGSGVIGRDVLLLEAQSAKDIEIWTFILVILLLLVIYQAPLLALIPLVTVFVAVQISVKLLAIMAGAGILNLSETIRIYITVLAYGAGVDYCLFLTARYREELERGAGLDEAVANAIGKVGDALTASAFTVIGGIGMLIFGRFTKYHEAGISIPFSLVIVLIGTMTFSAALLRLTGRWAFWPLRPPAPGPNGNDQNLAPGGVHRLLHASAIARVWDRVGLALLRRPGLILLASVGVLMPFAVLALVNYSYWNYGLVSALPPDTPSVRGTQMLEEHFSRGISGPATVVLASKTIDFGSNRGRELLLEMTERLVAQKSELKLSDVRSLAKPTGITPAGEQAQADQERLNPAARLILRNRAIRHYLGGTGDKEGHVTRLDVILAMDPLSHQAIDHFAKVEKAIRQSVPDALRDAQIEITGPTASLRDLRDVTTSDLRRIELMVPGVVFVILVVVLRMVVVSLYLIASVLFSYFATLGMTFVLFWAIDPAGFAGLDWKVPILLFAILVAVGEDYNIFLMTRVKEEQERHGPVRGIIAALVKTGGIISSCGFIMAGTFASLLAGRLIELKQLGFALAVGVLLDTLVVRPVLVPAFLVIVEYWRSPAARHPAPASVPATKST